jgi:hypothetical protein
MRKMMTRSLFASALFALLLAPAAFAGSTTGEIVSVEGDLVTVRVDDGSMRQYALPPQIRIVSPAHPEMRATDLRTGQTIRVTAEEAADTAQGPHPMAQSIVVVGGESEKSTDDMGDSSIHGVEIEKGRDVEIERDDDGIEIDYDD